LGSEIDDSNLVAVHRQKGAFRNIYLARLGETFDSGGYVHGVSEEISVFINADLACIYPDPKTDEMFGIQDIGISGQELSLHLASALDCVGWRVESGHETIAHSLDEASLALFEVLGYECANLLNERACFFTRRVGGSLGEALDVNEYDRQQTVFHKPSSDGLVEPF